MFIQVPITRALNIALVVMYLAGHVLENPNISRIVNDEEVDMCRISALLHDCGHAPSLPRI